MKKYLAAAGCRIACTQATAQAKRRPIEEQAMPDRNDRFTKKEDRMAEHIKTSEEQRGKSAEEAERIAYATVNKHKQEEKHDQQSEDKPRHG
jgi:hypothetical protein